MIYIRKITESSWFMGQAPLDSDSISDLGTSNHELSVWQVPNDKSNLDDIILALALTRDDTNGIFVVFIKKENIKEEYNWDIIIKDQDGDTAFDEMKNEHKNFLLSSMWEQGYFAEHIFNLIQDEANYIYYDEPKLISLLSSAIDEGRISIDDLKSHNKNKWFKAYKKYKGL